MTSRKRRILFVTSHLPFPPVNGGRRREYELLTKIAKNYDVYLCAITEHFDEDYKAAKSMHKYCTNVKVFPAADREQVTEERKLQLGDRIARFCSTSASEYIARVLRHDSIDLIHAEGFYLLQNISTDQLIPILLTEQNIEYKLWQQRSNLATNKAERARHLQQVRLTKDSELGAWMRASLCTVLTDEDRQIIRKMLPDVDVELIPDGFDHNPTLDVEGDAHGRIEVRIRNPSLMCVGNFAYMPNADSVKFLCEEIFPIIKKELPEAQLYLVGNAPSTNIKALGEISGITVTGRVQNLVPYYKNTDLVVCPLRIGGGIKVKILEAIHYGKAIVSTSIGVQGIPTIPNSPIVVADTPECFAKHVVRLLMNHTQRRVLEQNTAEITRMLATWDDAAHALRRCYETLLAEGGNLFHCSPV